MDQQMINQLDQMQKLQQAGAGIGVGGAVFIVIFYILFAYCIARIAKNVGMPFGSSFIWALVPIANFFLFPKMAGKPLWWVILMIIPIANIVVAILMWMAIAERMGKPNWWGIMIGIVPFLNFVFFLMLAFGTPEPVKAKA